MKKRKKSGAETRREFLAESLRRLGRLGKTVAGFEDRAGAGAPKIAPPAAKPAARRRQVWLNQRPPMPYIQLGQTGLMVSRLVFDLRRLPLQKSAVARGVNLLLLSGGAAVEPAGREALAAVKDRCWIGVEGPRTEELLRPLPTQTIERRVVLDAEALAVHVREALEAWGLPRAEALVLPRLEGPELLRQPDLGEALRELQRAGRFVHAGVEISGRETETLEAVLDVEAVEFAIVRARPEGWTELAPLLDEARGRGMGIILSSEAWGPWGAGPDGGTAEWPATEELPEALSEEEAGLLWLLRARPEAAVVARPRGESEAERLAALAGRGLTPMEAAELTMLARDRWGLE